MWDPSGVLYFEDSNIRCDRAHRWCTRSTSLLPESDQELKPNKGVKVRRVFLARFDVLQCIRSGFFAGNKIVLLFVEVKVKTDGFDV